MIAPKARKSVVTAFRPTLPTIVGTANSPPATNVAGRPLERHQRRLAEQADHAALLQVADADVDVVAAERWRCRRRAAAWRWR